MIPKCIEKALKVVTWCIPSPRSRHHNLVPVSEELLKEFGAAVNRGGSNEGSSAALRIVAGPRRPAGAITIKTLLSAGIMVAGQRVLSVEYKGNTTWGDLNEEGQITFAGQGMGG